MNVIFHIDGSFMNTKDCPGSRFVGVSLYSIIDLSWFTFPLASVVFVHARFMYHPGSLVLLNCLPFDTLYTFAYSCICANSLDDLSPANVLPMCRNKFVPDMLNFVVWSDFTTDTFTGLVEFL